MLVRIISIMANAQIHIDYLGNGRGGHYLLNAGYKFSIKTRHGTRKYWRCVIRDCPARATTVNDVPIVIRQDHNHPADTLKLAAFAFLNEVKKRCRDEVVPIPTIYKDEIAKLKNDEYDETVKDMIEKIPTLESCRQSLYNNRSKTLPKLPLRQRDIDLEGTWTQSTTGERFLLCDDTNDQGQRILIFATDDNLRNLCASELILGDGTFYFCPGLFYQLYTLHGSVENTVFPFVFAFLPNKTEVTYQRFFTLLKDATLQRNLVLTPETVLIDFEAGA
jgi:hypothetical protein